MDLRKELGNDSGLQPFAYHTPPFPPFFFFCGGLLRVAPGAAGFCCRGGTMLGAELVPEPGRGDVGGLLAVLLASLSYRKCTVRKRWWSTVEFTSLKMNKYWVINGFGIWFWLQGILLDQALTESNQYYSVLNRCLFNCIFSLYSLYTPDILLLSLKHGHIPNLTYKNLCTGHDIFSLSEMSVFKILITKYFPLCFMGVTKIW